MKTSNDKKPHILLTGATGYVGGRLKLLLEKFGYPVRCLTRFPENLSSHHPPTTEIMQGDVLNQDSLFKAMQGIDVAFYLVHSMGDKQAVWEKESLSAVQFAKAAEACGVKRIIYLGGLGNSEDTLSKHLQSRHLVGQLLCANAPNVQVLEFRASIIIGSGSLSFEMIKALSDKLPIMITPKWVWTEAQPISIQDVLQYLLKAIEIPVKGNKIIEIGSKEKTSYGGIMREYAKLKGHRLLFIPVPVLTPKLSSLWLGLVTPLYARVGRKLIESASCPTVVTHPEEAKIFGIEPLNVSEAISLALKNEENPWAETRWSDARSVSGRSHPLEPFPKKLDNLLVDRDTIIVQAPLTQAFAPILKIGGHVGWYYGEWLWSLRGFLDLCLGGVGLRRGRRRKDFLEKGEVLDFWRVEEIDPPHLLRLVAEMKVPGKAWLEFKVEAVAEGKSKITQTAYFEPQGWFGKAYWYLLLPIHRLVFKGMLKGIKQEIEK